MIIWQKYRLSVGLSQNASAISCLSAWDPLWSPWWLWGKVSFRFIMCYISARLYFVFVLSYCFYDALRVHMFHLLHYVLNKHLSNCNICCILLFQQLTWCRNSRLQKNDCWRPAWQKSWRMRLAHDQPAQPQSLHKNSRPTCETRSRYDLCDGMLDLEDSMSFKLLTVTVHVLIKLTVRICFSLGY